MQKQCLGDNSYNAVHQLTKTLEFLAHVDCYLEDAQKVNDSKSEEVWKTIRADREKHAGMLKELLATEIRENRF